MSMIPSPEEVLAAMKPVPKEESKPIGPTGLGGSRKVQRSRARERNRRRANRK